MSSFPIRIHFAKSIQHRAFFILLLVTCFWRLGISATIAAQDFGRHSIGELSSQSIAVPAVAPGPATFSLRYSLEGDGNLVVYNGSQPLWNTGVYGPLARLGVFRASPAVKNHRRQSIYSLDPLASDSPWAGSAESLGIGVIL